MVLLTSTQVSTAVSAGVIVVFTFALFLAGYALQQDTVKNLREAVKPRPGFPILPSSLIAEPTPVVNLGSMGEAKWAQEQGVLGEQEEEDQVEIRTETYTTDHAGGWDGSESEDMELSETATDPRLQTIHTDIESQKQSLLSEEDDEEELDWMANNISTATVDTKSLNEDENENEVAEVAQTVEFEDDDDGD